MINDDFETDETKWSGEKSVIWYFLMKDYWTDLT